MGALLLALQAAQILVPTIEGTVQVIRGATAPENPAPITTDEAAAVLNTLTEAATIVPAIASLVPMVQKAFGGEGFNDADLAEMKATADALDAQVAAKAAAIENEGTEST